MVGHCLLLAPSSSQGRSQAISSLSPHAKCPLAHRRKTGAPAGNSPARLRSATSCASKRHPRHSIPIARHRRCGGLAQRDLLATGRGAASPRWPPLARRARQPKDSLHYVLLDIGWRAPCGISALRSTMRLKWPSKRRSDAQPPVNGRCPLLSLVGAGFRLTPRQPVLAAADLPGQRNRRLPIPQGAAR